MSGRSEAHVPRVALWRHARAIGLLPVVVTLVVPALLLKRNPDWSIGWSLPAPWSALPVVSAGALFALGLLLMARTIALFHGVGGGTLAPFDSPRRLVVRGVYRHVRNPMISGVFAILLGEAVLLGSRVLLVWFLCFVLLNALYIPLVEEPDLERRFGDDYRLYKRSVRRWIPRRRPWQGLSE
jgi:protein-S-isoprenylcysteine O-methyltransferase Ste14